MSEELFTISRRAGWNYLAEIKVEIECDPAAPQGIKLGLAIRLAVKSGANLSGANLSEEDFRPFKVDLWATILSLHAIPVEMRHLVAKLRAGEVDGGTYGEDDNECACLVGTLAQPRGVAGDSLDHDANRPAERWFMMIKPGDVPGKTGFDGKETGGAFAARKALEWTLELAGILGVAVEDAPEVKGAAQ